MEQKIIRLTKDIEIKEKVIHDLEEQFETINERLTIERGVVKSWKENKTYLLEVKKETESNYTQIDNAASTLLEILKSKTDNI